MDVQSRQVKAYFDTVAPQYSARYSARRPYLNHLFSFRIALAMRGLDLEGKRVLDLGAGIGSLYDVLKKQGIAADYWACDISEAMLAQSQIPADRRLVGNCYEVLPQGLRFDVIFALGVSTYTSTEEWQRITDYAISHLAAGGLFIATHTHAASWELRWRRALRGLAQTFAAKRAMLGQNFQVQAYTPQDFQPLLDGGMGDYTFFNYCPFPFNRLLPRAAIAFDQRLAKKAHATRYQRLAGDFLLRLSANDPEKRNY